MESNLNFKNFGTAPPPDGGAGGGGWPPGSFPLTRQSSIYSLTFDEFQSTVGGIGKDFGSMNMDELIKNIWSAEENQNVGSSASGGGGGGGGVGGVQEGGGYLQRQGSLTLPRTLSLKTVEEVWRDMSKDANNGGGGDVGFGVPQREPTLGEVTLEEFLVRAGVVREEPQLGMKPNNAAFFGNLSHSVDNSQVGFGFQQSSNQISMQSNNLPLNVNGVSSNQISMQSNNLPLNVNGVRSVAHQLATQSPLRQQQQQQHQQQQLILPKQTALPYTAPLGISSNGQLSSPRLQNGLVQNAGLGAVGLGANGMSVTSGSPAVSSDGLTRSNGDTSSVSPVPYVFNGTMRGRKSAALEKVVERRQRRMIKNRESAARSRARKQAYTMELEAEVAKLKEENEELQKKQEEMMEMQKNQVLEMMNQQNGAKRRCLRRTQTGPW